MTEKQDLYAEILMHAIWAERSYVATLEASWWRLPLRKSLDLLSAANAVIQMIHAVPIALKNPDFGNADVLILNNQVSWFYAQKNKNITYLQNILSPLFLSIKALAPSEYRHTISWEGSDASASV